MLKLSKASRTSLLLLVCGIIQCIAAACAVLNLGSEVTSVKFFLSDSQLDPSIISSNNDEGTFPTAIPEIMVQKRAEPIDAHGKPAKGWPAAIRDPSTLL